MTPSTCVRCGAAGKGKFCARCGAALGAPRLKNADARSRERLAFLAAALSLGFLGLVALWSMQGRATEAPDRIGGPPVIAAAEGAPPDLSTMTPRERFDRLYNRVMRAAEQGDTVTVARFSPMAFLAYGQLDSVDVDARYHAAVLRLHVQGDTAGALRLADTIQMSNPRHLFVFLIRGTAARLFRNDQLLSRADSEFLAAWDSEMKVGRPEYRDHQVMLEQFRDMARRPGPKETPP